MATNLIYLERKENMRQITGNTKYTFNPNTNELRVYRKGNRVCRIEAQIGDIFEVTSDEKNTTVRKVEIPQENNKLALWILGFYDNRRADDLASYKKLYDAGKELYDESEYERKEIDTNSYKLTYYIHKESGVYYCAAGWASEEITHEEIKELLSGRIFPHPYCIIEKMMKQIGLTEKEIKEVYNS